MSLRWVEEKKGFFPLPYTPMEIKHLDVVGDFCIAWQGPRVRAGSTVVLNAPLAVSRPEEGLPGL